MDNQLELDLIGNLILKPELMKKLVITPENLFDYKNKFILELLIKQFKDYGTINTIGIIENYKYLFTQKFQMNEILQIMNLAIVDAPITDIDYLQQTIFERYVRKLILDEITKFKDSKISENELFDSLHRFESMSIKINDYRLSSDELFNLINSKNKNINLKFSKLSECANIQEHDLVVVAARPGIGKTGFILNILEDLSSKYNCILFNMEMSEKQVYQRLISINSGTPMKYLNNTETAYQEKCIKESCNQIANKKIKIYSQGQTISTIRRKIVSEAKNEHTIVFIDYVGLISTSSSDRKLSLYEKITSIVKELRQISLENDCTIFLVSQLNRQVENQKDKTPKISDLKESGELEQSATTVLLLHDENHDKNLSKSEIEISVIIGKNRNGKVGITRLNYNKENQQFSDIKKTVVNNNDWRKE